MIVLLCYVILYTHSRIFKYDIKVEMQLSHRTVLMWYGFSELNKMFQHYKNETRVTKWFILLCSCSKCHWSWHIPVKYLHFNKTTFSMGKIALSLSEYRVSSTTVCNSAGWYICIYMAAWAIPVQTVIIRKIYWLCNFHRTAIKLTMGWSRSPG